MAQKKNQKYKTKQLKNKRKEQNEPSDLLSKLDAFFGKNKITFFILSGILTIIIGGLLFDVRVSLAGDDSAYLIRAYDFIHKFKFPNYQGPLYPIVLSPLVYVFGINITLFKFISFLLILGHLWFFYKAFESRVPATILAFVLIIISINAYLLYFASQTYNEAFFMFFQALFFWYFFRHFIDDEKIDRPIRENYHNYLILSLLILAMGLTRSIGYGAIFAITGYYIFTKKWKPLAFSLGSFFGVFALFELIKRLIWGNAAVFNSQMQVHLQKDFYDASKGMEDFAGFWQRLIDNSNLYISKHTMMFLGFRPDNVTMKIAPTITVFVYLLFAAALVLIIYKNRKYLMFTGLYTGILSIVTFLILQKKWDQGRLILIFYPMILTFIVAGFYYLTKEKKFRFLQFIIPVGMVIIFFTTFARTSAKVKTHNDILRHNLKGDMLYGMTPDWQNYIKMCQWAAKNTPADEKIAARKPSVAFVNADRSFYGLYKVPSQDPDTLLNFFREKNIKYVVMASLRKYEQRRTEYTINTIKRILYYMQQKYPRRIRQVHKISNSANPKLDEPAYLFEIDLSE